MFLLDVLFPRRCLGCGRIGKYFCNKCSLKIRTIKQNEAICPVCERPAIDGRTHPKCSGRYSADGLTGFFRYDGIIRKAVKAIKYRFISDLAEEFAGLLPLTSYNFIKKNIPSGNVIIVPIPLHVKRQRQRGFNQAELLARRVSPYLGIPVRTDILK